MSRTSVKPVAWGSLREITREAPGWTTRIGPSSSVKPSPISGTHAIAPVAERHGPHDAAPSSRRPMPRSTREPEAPVSRRPPSRLDPDAAMPPSSRVPPSRVALDARVQTLGEALSETRAENAHLRAELEIQRRAFAAQAEAFERDTGELLATAERELVRLAMIVARRIVLRELETDPELVAAWAREVVVAAGFGSGVAAAVAPDVARAVKSEAWGELAPAVVVDAQLPAGTVELRDGARSAEVSANARLEAVAESIGATNSVAMRAEGGREGQES